MDTSDTEDRYEEELDPRVQVQLEQLNTCTDEINQLEVQLDEANAAFRNTLSDSSQRLKTLASKLGRCVPIARPYFEAKEAASKAQQECQRAAIQYQRACSIHVAAKETISQAEQKFSNKENQWEFDTAWQEMLNHATIKVMEAEALRKASEQDHEKRAAMYITAEQQVQSLERQLAKEIIKSRPYFEQKLIFQKTLHSLRCRVEGLQQAVTNAKRTYADSLQNLEMISEEIHERRKLRCPREPGVGAEVELQHPASPVLSMLTADAPDSLEDPITDSSLKVLMVDSEAQVLCNGEVLPTQQSREEQGQNACISQGMQHSTFLPVSYDEDSFVEIDLNTNA